MTGLLLEVIEGQHCSSSILVCYAVVTFIMSCQPAQVSTLRYIYSIDTLPEFDRNTVVVVQKSTASVSITYDSICG